MRSIRLSPAPLLRGITDGLLLLGLLWGSVLCFSTSFALNVDNLLLSLGILALGLTALLSWPLFALLGFPMPERLALLFFLIGGADLFRKLSQERDELVRKLLRLKLPGGRKGVTEQ